VSFDSEMSPKDSCIEGLVASRWDFGSGWIIKTHVLIHSWNHNLMTLLGGGRNEEVVLG
jgi:hypothetical protein